MGKKLIIKGADFSANGISTPPTPVPLPFLLGKARFGQGGTMSTIENNSKRATTAIIYTIETIKQYGFIKIPTDWRVSYVQGPSTSAIFSQCSDSGWQTPNEDGLVVVNYSTTYNYIIFTLKKSNDGDFNASDQALADTIILISE